MMDGMSKRSTRMAKRADFQNELRAVEEATGSSLAKNPAAAPTSGRQERPKGRKAQAEKFRNPEKKK